MDKIELEKLSDEVLLKREKSQKTFVGLYIGAIAGLLFFNIRDYLGGDTDMTMPIITLCALGGLFSIVPGYKELRAEVRRRA